MNGVSLFKPPETDQVIRSSSSGTRKSSPRLIDIIKPVEPKPKIQRDYVHANSFEDTSSTPNGKTVPLFVEAYDPATRKIPKNGKKKSSGRKKSSNRSRRKDSEVEEIYTPKEQAPQSSKYIIITQDRIKEEETEKAASKPRSVRRPDPPISRQRSVKKSSDRKTLDRKKSRSKNVYSSDHIEIAKPKTYDNTSKPQSKPRSKPISRPVSKVKSEAFSGGEYSMSPRKAVSSPKISNRKEPSSSEERPNVKLEGYEVPKQRYNEEPSVSNNKKIMDEVITQQGEEEMNLDSAIGVAIKAAAEKDVKDALNNDEQFRATLLKSMTRPNAVKDAVEVLVDERKKNWFAQKPGAKKSSNRKQSSKRKLPSAKPSSLRRDPFSVSDEDPIIETVEEKVSSKTRHIKVERRVPKNFHDSESEISESEHYETDEDSELEREKKVKLPNAYRKRKENEALGPPDELGNRDNIYDPLNAERPLYDRYEFEGDGNPYEESSEDEDMMTIDEKKDEMIYRFKLIQEAYPRVALPRITKRMKLARMVRHYDCVLDRLKLRRKTTNMRIFLVIGLLGVQFGLKWLTGLDTSGFTENQMQCIGLYTKYLREFGESDWSSVGENMPLWVRLPFAVAINFVIFMAAKFAYKASGKNLTGEFHKIYAEMTGDDSYNYLREKDTGVGLDDGEEGGGGLWGMLQKLVGGLGGGGGGGLGGILGGLFGGGGNVPKRGEAEGPNYVRRKKRDE